MTDLTYPHQWQPELQIVLLDGHNNKVYSDFNRLLYKNIPSKEDIKAGNGSWAKREYMIEKFKNFFVEELTLGEKAQSTLFQLFTTMRLYLAWADKEGIEAFTKTSVITFFIHLHQRVQCNDIKRTTYMSRRTIINQIFQCLEKPASWFDEVPVLPKNDSEPFEAYSNSDLKQLLPLLRAIFKQTSKQLLDNPAKHMAAWRTEPTMTFLWHGKSFRLCGGISKLMACATYLLAYYTYCNSSQLYSLKRPNRIRFSMQETWYAMPAFKRRAFKVIHVEIGEHCIEVPKYSMQFFDTLLKVSEVIDPSNDALLLQTCSYNSLKPISGGLLNDFNHRWLHPTLLLTDSRGRRLTPVISRFRETGSQLAEYYQGDIEKSILLDNTLNVQRKHYSTGNTLDNKKMIQEAVLIRSAQAKHKKPAIEARETLEINILTIEEYQHRLMPKISRTAHGSHCKDPFGKRSEKFNRKVKQHQLSLGEQLACANLLECFGCPEQVIVQSVKDIWCLLSFKECIEESLFLHLNTHHYKKNFKNILNFIEKSIFPNISRDVLKQAELKLSSDGRHPLWQEAESVLLMANKEQ